VKHLSDHANKTKFALILDKIESLSAAMTLSHLLNPPSTASSERSSVDEKTIAVDSNLTQAITIEALRLIELTNRTSAVLRSQEADSLVYNDPVISVYRTFGQLNRFNVTANMSVVSQEQFADTVARHVSETSSQMAIIPWPRGVTSVLNEENQSQKVGVRNPFDGVFHKTTTLEQTSSIIFSEFIRNVFAKSPSDVVLFVDRGLNNGSITTSNQHLFLPFFGGPDDRLALTFLVQLCENPSVTATVVKITTRHEAYGEDVESLKSASPTNAVFYPNITAAADTIYGQSNSQIRLESNTADNLTWERFANPTQTKTAFSRITFRTEISATPLRLVTKLTRTEAATRNSGSDKTLIVLMGRSRRMGVKSLLGELGDLITESGSSISTSVPKTLGDVGAALVATNVNASLLILQAAPDHE
jgi:hypothetical protein